MECPKHLVGRVIGRGGETIQMLQAKTGARIQIDQNVADVRTPYQLPPIQRDTRRKRDISFSLRCTTLSFHHI